MNKNLKNKTANADSLPEERKNMAFDKINFILVAVGVVIILIGFLLMIGPSSTETHFEPDIFSVRRIKVAPVVCFLGFVFMIFAILRKPKSTSTTK